MPLTVGDWNVSWELEEDWRILRIVLEQVDVDARVDCLKQHTAIGRVVLRAAIGEVKMKFLTQIIKITE